MPALDHAEMAKLEAEWIATTTAADPAWGSDIHLMCQEQDALKAAGEWVAGPSDLLSVLGRSRRETYHSALLAWLLDPAGRHRLGTAMLRAVFARCFPEIQPQDLTLAACSTATEVNAPTSRADIVVTGSQLKIVIETKVDAAEGHRQCQRLFDDHHEEETLFIFLTPRGVSPVTAETDEAREAWRLLSFRDVRDDLSFLLTASPDTSNPALATAFSYLDTLRKEFP